MLRHFEWALRGFAIYHMIDFETKFDSSLNLKIVIVLLNCGDMIPLYFRRLKTRNATSIRLSLSFFFKVLRFGNK